MEGERDPLCVWSKCLENCFSIRLPSILQCTTGFYYYNYYTGVGENSSFIYRAIQLLRLQSQMKDQIGYSNHSSRNHSPLSQTPIGSPGTMRNLSMRRTWFPSGSLSALDQFQPISNLSRENSHDSSSEIESNQKICDVIFEGNGGSSNNSNRRQIQIPKRYHTRTPSYSSSINCESDSAESLRSSRSSLRSSTNDLLLTPDTCVGKQAFGSQSSTESQVPVVAPGQSWYVSVTDDNNINNEEKKLKPKPVLSVKKKNTQQSQRK